MPTIESTNGVQLATYDFGGVGPTLVLSHATGFHARVYDAMARHLAERFRCVGLDYRAHGDSSVPASETFDWHGYGDDALAFTRHLDTRPLFGFGHSMGGATLLMTELNAPGTFSALVVYEPIVFPDDEPSPQGPENSLASGARRRRSTFASYQAAIDNYASKMPLGAWRSDVLADYVNGGFRPNDTGEVTLKCAGEHEARTFEQGGTHGTFQRLENIQCPVLVITGTLDIPGPGNAGELAAGLIPKGHHLRFDQLTHFGPMEDPALIANTAADFFASVVS